MASQKKATATTRQIRISTVAIQNINEITGYIAFVQQEPINSIKVGNAIFATLYREDDIGA